MSEKADGGEKKVVVLSEQESGVPAEWEVGVRRKKRAGQAEGE